jgi:hypothetical protein
MKCIKNAFVLSFLVINLSICPPTAEETEKLNLQKDFDEISLTKKRTKLAACMSIVRNSLAEGNNEMKEALRSSGVDKSKGYDKIVLAMLENCQNKIKDEIIEKVLDPENIISIVSSDSTISNLIKINFHNILNGEETEAHQQISKEITDASQLLELDLQEEEIGLFGIKVSQIGNIQYIFVAFGLFLTFAIVFGGLYLILFKKKTTKKDKKKKE